MANAGWYPDPGGQPGRYRYWDGHAWSAVTTSNPSAPAPNQGLGQSAPPQTRPTGYQADQQPTRKRSGVGWWLGGAAVLVVLIIVGVLVIKNLGGGDLSNPGVGGDGSSDPCPTTSSSPSAAPDHPADGRVHGGPISYPELGTPWSRPLPENRLAYGSDVHVQEIPTDNDSNPPWVASVLIAQLIAGDGFFTPQQGAQIVAKCIVGAFYGDNPVDRHDQVSKAMTVDGHQAWYLRSHLTFDIPDLNTNGETMTLVIINAGDTSGLLYTSIPDNANQYQAPADDLIPEITVDS